MRCLHRYYTDTGPWHITSPALAIHGRFILRQPISRQKNTTGNTCNHSTAAGERPRVLHAVPRLVAQHHAHNSASPSPAHPTGQPSFRLIFRSEHPCIFGQPGEFGGRTSRRTNSQVHFLVFQCGQCQCHHMSPCSWRSGLSINAGTTTRFITHDRATSQCAGTPGSCESMALGQRNGGGRKGSETGGGLKAAKRGAG